MSTEKCKIKYDFVIQTVDGRPMKEQYVGDNGEVKYKELNAADSLASFLSMRTEGEKMQYMEWARELFKTKAIELTNAQIKIMKELIKKENMTAVLEEAFILPLDNAELKLTKKPNGK